MLDNIADDVIICYGSSSAFGIVSKTLTSAGGINDYLQGLFQDITFGFETRNICSRQAVIQQLALPLLAQPQNRHHIMLAALYIQTAPTPPTPNQHLR